MEPGEGVRRPVERLLTVEEVAEILSVSSAWVYDHADRKRPRIPSVRLGKAVRFRPEDVRAFIEAATRRVA
jgi:excisionase family DNA binding protein